MPQRKFIIPLVFVFYVSGRVVRLLFAGISFLDGVEADRAHAAR